MIPPRHEAPRPTDHAEQHLIHNEQLDLALRHEAIKNDILSHFRLMFKVTDGRVPRNQADRARRLMEATQALQSSSDLLVTLFEIEGQVHPTAKRYYQQLTEQWLRYHSDLQARTESILPNPFSE